MYSTNYSSIIITVLWIRHWKLKCFYKGEIVRNRWLVVESLKLHIVKIMEFVCDRVLYAKIQFLKITEIWELLRKSVKYGLNQGFLGQIWPNIGYFGVKSRNNGPFQANSGCFQANSRWNKAVPDGFKHVSSRIGAANIDSKLRFAGPIRFWK